MTFEFGAGKEARTPDIYLGKVMLYQLSYTRNIGENRLSLPMKHLPAELGKLISCSFRLKTAVDTVARGGTCKYLPLARVQRWLQRRAPPLSYCVN